MKKFLLFVVFSYLFANYTVAQSGPLVPKEESIKVKNCYVLYEAFTNTLRIPVYLTTAANTNIRYCWYPTKSSFGEIVRTSDNPEIIEEGTYTNGLLTLYKKGNILYRIFWSSNREIIKIELYNSSGSTIDTYNLGRRHWIEYKMITNTSGKISRRIGYRYLYIRNLLVDYTSASMDHVNYLGYYINDNTLFKIFECYVCPKNYIEFFDTSVYRRYWKHEVDREYIVEINSDGSFKSKDSFDFEDSTRCEYYYF